MSWAQLANITFIVVCAGLLLWALQLLGHWNSKRRTNQRIEGFVKKIKDGTQVEKPSETNISLSTGGFSILSRKSTMSAAIHWSEIERIIAFKRDFWSHDCICVAFELSAGKSVEIDESMDGFVPLMEKVGEIYPGATPFGNWYMQIMAPAFETKLTEIWRRADQPSAHGHSSPA